MAGVRDLGAVVAQARGLHFLVDQALDGPMALEYERWLNKLERSYQRALRPYRTKVSSAVGKTEEVLGRGVQTENRTDARAASAWLRQRFGRGVQTENRTDVPEVL